MATPEGLDDTKLSLTEHLGELRMRLAKSLLAIVVTTAGAAFFAPEILDYSITPLTNVLKSRARVETVLVHDLKSERGAALAERLDDHERVRFLGTFSSLEPVRELAEDAVDKKAPVELVLVDAKSIGDDGALVSDILEDIEPTPYVVYLVDDPKSEIVIELQLEGALVVLDPPRNAALNRVVRRAAAAAGKATSGDKLVVLSPLEPFFAYLKIALVCGLFLACPIWLYQAWRFVAPGLYSNEKKAVAPVIASASFLFIGGGLFAYYAMFPVMFDFLVNQMMPASLTGSFTVDNYLGLLLRITVAFGVVFELPLALAMLAAVGIVSAAGLRKYRKYAIVLSFVAGAFLTPADPLSQLMMAVPLVVFYEIGVILATIMEKKRAASSEELAMTQVD